MKKVIVAIDGLKPTATVVQYAVEFARLMNAHLVGVFLEDFTYHSYKVYELVGREGLLEEKKKMLDENDRLSRALAVSNFEESCRKAGLHFSIHHDRNIAIHELLHESVYADLLIIGAKETLTHYEENIPTRFIRDLLTEVQCPVVVVPEQYKPINKATLLYDGEPSAVFAIRMFSYLFPLLPAGAEVLSVKSANDTLHLPDNRLMKEFMKRHFPEAIYTVLKGIPETEIVNYMKEQEKPSIIVLGAYRRGMVSRWLKASLADTLMQQLSLPVFIAHNK